MKLSEEMHGLLNTVSREVNGIDLQIKAALMTVEQFLPRYIEQAEALEKANEELIDQLRELQKHD